MLLRQLVCLRALARERHFGRAASSRPPTGRSVGAAQLVEPQANHVIGLTSAEREPLLPITRAMLEIARGVGKKLERSLAIA